MTCQFSLLTLQTPDLLSSPPTQNSDIHLWNKDNYIELASVNSWELHNTNVSDNNNIDNNRMHFDVSKSLNENESANISMINQYLRKRHHDSFSRLCFVTLKSSLTSFCTTIQSSNKTKVDNDNISSKLDKKIPNIFKIIWKVSSGTFHVPPNNSHSANNSHNEKNEAMEKVNEIIQRLFSRE
jgi:hypothetical protein